MGIGFLSRQRWALHNPLKSWTLKDMMDHELQLVMGTLTSAERQLCLIWKKGWADWKRMATIADFEFQPPIAIVEGAPPLPGNPLLQGEEEVTQVKILGRGPDRQMEDRRHGRHEICVPVEIIQGSQTFRTETLDISTSGVRFKDPIPDWVAGYFTVLFRGPLPPFEITCALVEDQKNNKDCAEVFDTNDEESGLQTYLAWVKSFAEK